VLSTLLNDLVRKCHVMPVDEIDSSEEKKIKTNRVQDRMKGGK
jgi:hypothetical protein